MQRKGLRPIVTFRLFSCVPIKKRMSQMKPYFLSGWFSSTSSEFSYKNAMCLCTISCETTVREWHIFNWHIWRKLKKKKEKKKLFRWFITFWFGTFARLFRAIWVFWVTKTLEDEQYVVIMTYKCRFFGILKHCASTLFLYIESTDSITVFHTNWSLSY